MSRYRIAWLPGDGIGREVMEATRIVLDELDLDADYIEGDIGWRYWCEEGDALPARTIALLRSVDAALFGAVTSKPTAAAEAELDPALRGKSFAYRSPIVRMRQLFDLYVCLRPCRTFAGNPLNYREPIDIVVFRENTEDLYAGVEFAPVPIDLAHTLLRMSAAFSPFGSLPGSDYAVSCKINTRKGSRRIAEAAFDFARKNGRRRVTIVHKANVVRATDGLFLEEARKVAAGHPEVVCDEANVDAIGMWLLKDPGKYDVLLAPNLYGDIVSDLCAQLVGGLGFACSGNIGERLAVFEPTHGSAPRHAGRYEANPIATILAARMMLDWLGETEKARRVEAAVAEVIRAGEVRTYDMGGHASTMDMARAVALRVAVSQTVAV